MGLHIKEFFNHSVITEGLHCPPKGKVIPISKGYISPYAPFACLSRESFQKLSYLQNYNGTLEKAILDLSQTTPLTDIMSSVHFTNGVTRVLAGTMEYKIENHLEGAEALEIIQKSAEFGLNIFHNTQNIKDASLGYYDRLVSDYSDIGNTPIKRPDCWETWISQHPMYARRTVRRLMGQSNMPLLFIVIGYGAIVPGIDVFLRLPEYTRKNSILYPVRFSRYKKNDVKPRLTDSEIDYLDQSAHGRRVIIFDLLKSSGDTIDKAAHFFERILPHASQLSRVLNNPE